MPADPVNDPARYDPDPLDHESREAMLARAFWSLAALALAFLIAAGITALVVARFGWLGLATAVAAVAGLAVSYCAAARR